MVVAGGQQIGGGKIGIEIANFLSQALRTAAGVVEFEIGLDL